MTKRSLRKFIIYFLFLVRLNHLNIIIFLIHKGSKIINFYIFSKNFKSWTASRNNLVLICVIALDNRLGSISVWFLTGWILSRKTIPILTTVSIVPWGSMMRMLFHINSWSMHFSILMAKSVSGLTMNAPKAEEAEAFILNPPNHPIKHEYWQEGFTEIHFNTKMSKTSSFHIICSLINRHDLSHLCSYTPKSSWSKYSMLILWILTNVAINLMGSSSGTKLRNPTND